MFISLYLLARKNIAAVKLLNLLCCTSVIIVQQKQWLK